MNKEEIREYIVAKRKPISHCVDLTRYFIGKHKTLPIFLTPTFEIEFNRSMQELEILREQVKKQKEVIDKIKKLIKSKDNGICFYNNKKRSAYTFVLNFDEARQFIWDLEDILNEVE